MRYFTFGMIIFFCFCVPCRGKTYERHGICYAINTDSTVSVIGCKKKATTGIEVVIPDFIKIRRKNYSVTCLESFAFSNCAFLKSLVLPQSIEKLCRESIVFCDSLSSIKIPENVSIIEDGAIYGNNNLKELLIDPLNGFYYSGNNCNGIIRRQDSCLVTGCKNTIISDDVISIAPDAFRACEGLQSITIPNNVCEIGFNAFGDCINLKTVSLNKGIKKIGNAAFRDCVCIDSIMVPDGTKEIGDWAFNGCSSLRSVSLPNSVEFIGEGVFGDCGALSSLYIDSDNLYYSSYGFSNVIVKKDGKVLIAGCATSTVPNDIEVFSYGAFMSCVNLDSISFSDNLKVIEDGAFCNCTSLKSIKIPDKIKRINEAAFMNCHMLNNIDLPDSLEIIGCDAFNNCQSLKDVVIPDKVWCIDRRAFMNCKVLETVTIPESVNTIGNYCFAGCNNLKDIYMYCPVPPGIGSKSFAPRTTLHVKKGSKKTYKKEKYWRRVRIVEDLE